MTDEPIETFVAVQCCAPERVLVYIIKGRKSEVISRAQSLHQWFTITTLKPAASQTANPWSGTVLEEVAFTHPVDSFLEAVRYAGHHLREFPAHQRSALVAKAGEILNQAAAPSLVERDESLEHPPVVNLPLEDVKRSPL